MYPQLSIEEFSSMVMHHFQKINELSEIDAKDRGILESQLDELQIWDALNDVLKWSRLYGGAVGFIMIEGQAPMTPLRPETIG